MARPLRDFALEVFFSRWEFAVAYNIGGSDSQNLTIQELLDLGSDDDRGRFFGHGLGYTETYGAPTLRARIAATYETVSPDDILCFAGAEEAIYVAMTVLLGEGDHAVVLTPNYQSVETLPLSRCDVTGVPLEFGDRWDLDLEKLRAAVRPNTKLIAVNFPNNPTGCVISRDKLQAIIDLCRKRNIWLFSDEVYRLLERRPDIRLPQAVDLYERAISLNVLSKAYGLPGLRIGWLACKDKALLTSFERYKHFLSICNSAPSEVLAEIALSANDKILDRNRQIIDANLALLDSFFAEFPDLFEWVQPDGGCVAFLRYKGPEGVEAFTQQLVEDAGVLLLPASVFKSELTEVPADHFRIGFGRSHFPDGLAAMRNWLRRNAP